MSKITLFAMTEKGYTVVKVLLSHYPELIAAIVAAKDKNIENDYFEEIKCISLKNNIPFYNRRNFSNLCTPFAIAISWRWLIKSDSTKVIVFHDSILPKYRGFNPLVTALINGDDEIGVTALYAAEEYDKGDIIACSKSSIAYPIKIKAAINIILNNYRELAIKIAESIKTGKVLDANVQNESFASYSLWRDNEDYFIDWTQSADYIDRFVDALGSPYKGATTFLGNSLVRVLDTEVVKDVNIVNRTPGKVIFLQGINPVIVCGQGLLKINELVDERNECSLLPLTNFRIRLTQR